MGRKQLKENETYASYIMAYRQGFGATGRKVEGIEALGDALTEIAQSVRRPHCACHRQGSN